MAEPILINVTEEIVTGLVRFLLHGNEYQTFCHCKFCELETIAIALNGMPSKYVASNESRDAAFVELNTTKNVELINKQIIRAIHMVGRQPKHI